MENYGLISQLKSIIILKDYEWKCYIYVVNVVFSVGNKSYIYVLWIRNFL